MGDCVCGSEDAAAEALRQELEIIKEHARQQATREDAVSLTIQIPS